jgi:hypothetical protein
MVSRIPGTSPGRSLLGYSWSNEISCGQPIKPWKETLPVRIFAGIITIIVLMATGITGLFLGIAAF